MVKQKEAGYIEYFQNKWNVIIDGLVGWTILCHLRIFIIILFWECLEKLQIHYFFLNLLKIKYVH